MPPKKRAKRAQNDPWGDQPASPGPWDEPGEDPWRFVSCGGAGVDGVSVVSGVPDDGVGQDPWHTEKQDKKRQDHQLGCHVAKPQKMSMMPMQPTLPGFALLLVLHASGKGAKSQVARKGASTTLTAAILDAWASLTLMERSHLLPGELLKAR